MSSSRCPTLTHSEALAGATIALTGSGSSGVMAAGTLLLAAAARAGAHGPVVRTGGPQIRGGEATALVRLADGPVGSLGGSLDLQQEEHEHVELIGARLARVPQAEPERAVDPDPTRHDS